MNNQLLPKNHFTLNESTNIKSICMPLEQYGISFFTYFRCYDDGSVIALVSDKDIYYHHFQQEYLMAPYIPENMLKDKFYYFASPNNVNVKFNEAYYEYTSKFKLLYPIYMFERYKGYVDIFVFATSDDDYKIINFYVNNMDILESFKLYFKDKAAKIVCKANKSRIVIPNCMRLNFTGLSSNDDITKNVNFLKEHTNNINHILKLHFNTKLTQRELQSLSCLLRGRTAAETAQTLNISPKTIESYIESVKNKLNCLTRSELFNKIFDRNLINIITKI